MEFDKKFKISKKQIGCQVSPAKKKPTEKIATVTGNRLRSLIMPVQTVFGFILQYIRLQFFFRKPFKNDTKTKTNYLINRSLSITATQNLSKLKT